MTIDRIALETKLAFQDKTIADLNDALVDQSKTVIQLLQRVEILEKVVRNFNHQIQGMVETPPNERPPHY